MYYPRWCVASALGLLEVQAMGGPAVVLSELGAWRGRLRCAMRCAWGLARVLMSLCRFWSGRCASSRRDLARAESS